MTEESIANMEQLLKDSGWLKALAWHLVRDDAAAADVVQETWLAALRGGPADGRAVRSWLARVAGNLARKFHRDRTRRHRRERAAAKSESVGATPDRLLQRAELQRSVAEAVLALKEPVRTAILLRFFEDLSVREIARRGSAPVSTVKSRLATGLARLRTRLDHRYGGDRQAWLSLMLPMAGLSAAVSTAAGESLASASWLALKGAVMSSKIAFAAGSIVVLGLVAWVTFGPGPDSKDDAHDPERSVSMQDYEKLQKKHKAGLTRLRMTEKQRDLFRQRAKALEDELAARHEAPAASDAGTEATSGEAGPEKAPLKQEQSRIDLSGLAELMGENIGDVAQVMRLMREGQPVPKELRSRIGRFITQLMQYGMKLKSLGSLDTVIFDRALCIDIMVAAGKDTLKLTDAQIARITQATHASFDELLGDAKPETLLPIERHRLLAELRVHALENIEGILGDALLQDEEVKTNWAVLKFFRKVGDGVLGGVTPEKRYGLNAKGVESEVLDDWKEYYALDEGQVDQLKEPASDYVKQAREVLAQYGENDEAIRLLPAEQKEALELALLKIQQQEEQRVAELLSDVQRANVQGKRPFVRSFNYLEITRTSEPVLFNVLKWIMK